MPRDVPASRTPPHSSTAPPADLPAVLTEACTRAGFHDDAQLLRHFANAVYLLRMDQVVARVAYGPDSIRRSNAGIAVAGWLAGRGFPATTPADLPNGAQQPVVVPRPEQEVAVTFWRYYPQPSHAGWPDPAVVGNLAVRLHRHATPATPLRAFQPLRTLHTTLLDQRSIPVLGADDHVWLLGRVNELRQAFARLEFPLGLGLIHTDLYAGNLLWDTATDHNSVVLGDWDSVCLGPREVDLVPTYHERRFGAEPAAAQLFASAYGYDVASWDGFRVLYEIRELSTLSALIRLAPKCRASAAELTFRLRTLRDGDRNTLWHGQ